MTIWRRLFGGEKAKASKSRAAMADSRRGPEQQGPEGFKDAEELEYHVTEELKRCVPRGWHVKRLDGRRFAWAIKNERPRPGEWPDQEYDVWITKGLDLLIITHDNCDIGVGRCYEHAVVLHVGQLRSGFGLSRAVQDVMSRFKPNEWGYT